MTASLDQTDSGKANVCPVDLLKAAKSLGLKGPTLADKWVAGLTSLAEMNKEQQTGSTKACQEWTDFLKAFQGRVDSILVRRDQTGPLKATKGLKGLARARQDQKESIKMNPEAVKGTLKALEDLRSKEDTMKEQMKDLTVFI